MNSSSLPQSSAVLKWSFMFILCIVGVMLSLFLPSEATQVAVETILGSNGARRYSSKTNASRHATTAIHLASSSNSTERQPSDERCWQRLVGGLETDESNTEIVNQLLALETDGVAISLHRNGNVDGCGMSLDFLSQLRATVNGLGEDCPASFGKYETESVLTSALHHALGDSCTSEEPDREPSEGFLGYCDMGEKKTPILLDHEQLVPVILDKNNQENAYLPCHFHSREGVRLTSFAQLAGRMVGEYNESKDNCSDEESETCSLPQVDLYAVPAGRVFMFAPKFMGEIFDLPHIQGADPTQPVYMKVLSVSPRVFDIFNYFTKEESNELVSRALAEKSDTHRIKRSSTGSSGYNINNFRTSENGFDTHGAVAQRVKRRCFSMLGFDEYIEGHSDGLQILRYNQTKAYNAHMDWIDDSGGKQEHNYDSAGKGGNRYATILMYMADLEPGAGGETYFANSEPLDDNAPTYREALNALRVSEAGKAFTPNSWEEKLVAKCRSSLAIRPNSARAVLFYSQLPNGAPDPASLHGGCPVVAETPKWAANLWVWNTPRPGFEGAPVHEDRVAAKKAKGEAATENVPSQKHVTFQNSGRETSFSNAELFYMDQFWGKFGSNDAPHAVNTYEGQVWNIKVNGETKKTFVVGKEPRQVYTV